MVRYAFDLYPRTDPRDGTVIRRFEHLQEASYRAEENGTGSGQIMVSGASEDADDIDPRGLQYVRVLEIDDSDVETVKGGFWLEQGKFQALTRKETKHLEFGGAGTLAYLQRAVMWSRTYIHGVFTGQDPIGTTWDLANQSTFYANGNHLGAMLWRVIYEAQHFQSGAYTHRHYDFEETGVAHTGTHADDRTESAIPDVVMTFDQNEDSSGNPWTLTAGTFTAQVGESVLSVVRRLMELGLKVEMDPDTFELNAWEAPHRTDRTSTTWASGKVLFTAPTAQDIDTGNILSDTIRTIRAFIKRSIVLAGSDNVYAISEGATDIPWEGGYRFDTEDTTTAEDVASRQRLARSDAVDHLKVVMKLGNAPLQGKYRPWVHVNPGDLVTVDTGTDQWEFDNTTFPVAALTVELKQGGDWRAIAELGSSFTSLLEPAFQVGGAPAHTHPPNPALCLPPQEGTDSSTRLYFSAANHGFSPAPSAEWDTGTASVQMLTTAPDGSFGTTHSDTSNASGDASGINVLHFAALYGPLSSAEAAILAAGGAEWRGQVRGRMRYGIGIDEGDQAGVVQMGVRVTAGATTTIRGTALALHSVTEDGSNNLPAHATKYNREVTGTLSAVGATVAGDYLLVEVGVRNYTISSEPSGSGLGLTGLSSLEDLPEGNDNSGAVLNSWVQWTVVGTGATTGDLPLDTVHQGLEKVGSASRAARCDHQHGHGLLSEDGTEYHDFGVTSLSDDTPLVPSGTGSSGTQDEASRSDHVHPVPLTIEDEGSAEGSNIDTLDFVGAGVSVSVTGSQATIDIPGGGGGSSVVPWAIYPEYGASETATGGVGANNRTIYVPITIPADCTITGVRIRVASGGGSNQISLALVDSGGTRVATTGAITTPANGISANAFTSSYAATAGRYWLAISASSSGTTFALLNAATNNSPAYVRFENAHPVPASMTSAGESSVKPVLVGMISGGAP